MPPLRSNPETVGPTRCEECVSVLVPSGSTKTTYRHMPAWSARVVSAENGEGEDDHFLDSLNYAVQSFP